MRAATIVAAPIRLQYFLIAYLARNVVKMAVRCDEDVVKSVISRCIQKLGYTQLKPEQLKVILEFLNGRDVFAVLPTGYGKTLCFACLPLIF